MLSFIKMPVIYVRVIALAHLDVAKRSVKFIIGIVHGIHICSWSQHSIYHGLQQSLANKHLLGYSSHEEVQMEPCCRYIQAITNAKPIFRILPKGEGSFGQSRCTFGRPPNPIEDPSTEVECRVFCCVNYFRSVL